MTRSVTPIDPPVTDRRPGGKADRLAARFEEEGKALVLALFVRAGVTTTTEAGESAMPRAVEEERRRDENRGTVEAQGKA